MSLLVQVKERRLCPVPIRGVFTLPSEDATVRCRCPEKPCEGIKLTEIPLKARTFQKHAYELKDKLIAAQRSREREFAGGLELHGPFPSYDLNQHLTDVRASMWQNALRPDQNGDQHPEVSLDAVFERDKAFNPYSDYYYTAMFLGYEYYTRKSSDGGLPLG